MLRGRFLILIVHAAVSDARRLAAPKPADTMLAAGLREKGAGKLTGFRLPL